MRTPNGPGGARGATAAIALACAAWALGILVLVAMPDPPYVPLDVEPDVRGVIFVVWLVCLAVPTAPAALGLTIALLCLRMPGSPPAPGEAPHRGKSISARVQARGGEPAQQTAHLAAVLAGTYLGACAIAAIVLLALGRTPGEALSPSPPATIGPQWLVPLGHDLRAALHERDVRALARHLDQRLLLERIHGLDPTDLPRLRRVRESIEGAQLAERVLDCFPPGEAVELAGTQAGPVSAYLTFAAAGHTLQLEVSYGRDGDLTVVDVHDEAGPWREQLLREADEER